MGGDVKSLKDIMGHASLATTMIYLKMSDKRKQGLMNNFDIMGL
jgi:site-specific recombinase XerD